MPKSVISEQSPYSKLFLLVPNSKYLQKVSKFDKYESIFLLNFNLYK